MKILHIFIFYTYMNQELIKLCLIEIYKLNQKINRNRYKVKYSDEYYLNFILYMLNDINKWSFIVKLKDYKSNSKYHYKTIYNKFVYWSKNNIFYNAFYNYYFKHNTNLLLIDATTINNKYGSELLIINPELKKKKVTKLSIISNNKNFINSITVFDIKTKNNNYSTGIYDVKMIKKTLEKVLIKNKSKYYYYYLLGDKANKTKEIIKLHNKIIKIITPDKKNTKNKIYKFYK